MRPLVVALVIALALVASVGATTANSADRASASNASTCRGTLPNHRIQPGSFDRDGFNYGNAQLRAHLNWKNGWLKAGIFADGGATATINADGSIRTKQGWWRGPRGTLVIRGRRLDGPSSAWRAEHEHLLRRARVHSGHPHVPDDGMLARYRDARNRQAHLRGQGHEAAGAVIVGSARRASRTLLASSTGVSRSERSMSVPLG